MPNFTDEELRKHDEEVVKKTTDSVRSQVESEIIKDTTWKSLGAMKESAMNADKRIGESVQKEKEASEKAKTLEGQIEELKKKGGTPPAGKPEDDVSKDPASFLRTITDAEEKKLDEMMKSNPVLRKEVLASGEVGMAKALQHLRKITPPEDKTIKEDAPFSSWRKTAGKGGQVSLEEMMTKANEEYQKRHRIPNSTGNRGAPAAGAMVEGEEDVPQHRRGGGGMDVMAADGANLD